MIKVFVMVFFLSSFFRIFGFVIRKKYKEKIKKIYTYTLSFRESIILLILLLTICTSTYITFKEKVIFYRWFLFFGFYRNRIRNVYFDFIFFLLLLICWFHSCQINVFDGLRFQWNLFRWAISTYKQWYMHTLSFYF